jgi:hypothetical protein
VQMLRWNIVLLSVLAGLLLLLLVQFFFYLRVCLNGVVGQIVNLGVARGPGSQTLGSAGWERILQVWVVFFA